MAMEHHHHGQQGDFLETHSRAGQPSRRGEILEVLGREGHEHYRVRWEDGRESMVYPADGVHIIPASERAGA